MCNYQKFWFRCTQCRRAFNTGPTVEHRCHRVRRGQYAFGECPLCYTYDRDGRKIISVPTFNTEKHGLLCDECDDWLHG